MNKPQHNGTLDLDPMSTALTIGSLEGNGIVTLNPQGLSIGSNSLSTTFSGVIQATGEITKIGTGTLTLSGASNYLGLTTINSGTLLVTNPSGSATGGSDVQVNGGSLGGSGIIFGAVTVGNGAGQGAVLSPGGARRIGTLTLQRRVDIRADGVYQCGINSDRLVADQLTTNGAIINSAAFRAADSGSATLPPRH